MRTSRRGPAPGHPSLHYAQDPVLRVLNEEGWSSWSRNADTILEAIGIDFRDDPEASRSGRPRGPTYRASGVFHFARGMCRALIQASAPREFTQHARNPARNVVNRRQEHGICPAYGSPFVRSLDEGRRYARIEDFRISSSSPTWPIRCNHSGGTICDPWICR